MLGAGDSTLFKVFLYIGWMKETIKVRKRCLYLINFHLITLHSPFFLIYIIQTYYQITYQSFWIIIKLKSAIESRKAYKFYPGRNKNNKICTNKNGNSKAIKNYKKKKSRRTSDKSNTSIYQIVSNNS